MRVVELTDAANGRVYRVNPDDISGIIDRGEDGTTCALMLMGRELVVEGSAAEVLKKITDALRGQ